MYRSMGGGFNLLARTYETKLKGGNSIGIKNGYKLKGN